MFTASRLVLLLKCIRVVVATIGENPAFINVNNRYGPNTLTNKTLSRKTQTIFSSELLLAVHKQPIKRDDDQMRVFESKSAKPKSAPV